MLLIELSISCKKNDDRYYKQIQKLKTKGKTKRIKNKEGNEKSKEERKKEKEERRNKILLIFITWSFNVLTQIQLS